MQIPDELVELLEDISPFLFKTAGRVGDFVSIMYVCCVYIIVMYVHIQYVVLQISCVLDDGDVSMYLSLLCLSTVVLCSDPGSISGGRRQFTNPGVNGVLLGVGSVITYSCDARFTLVGDREVTCLESGVYSPSKPRCEGVCFNQCLFCSW